MKILVTGGAGFIGSHVVDAYVAAGHEVVIIDNLSTGSRSNLNPKATFYEADIRNIAELRRIIDLEKPEIINHHAAAISVTGSAAKPLETYEINVLGTVNLLLAGLPSLKKFIFISTGGALYSSPAKFPAKETEKPTPLSPYGFSKQLAEEAVMFYCRQQKVPFTILRYSNVYGPRQNPHGESGVMAIFTMLAAANKQPTIYRKQTTRDYVYAGDIARANVLALSKGKNEIINIGTSRETSNQQVYEAVAREYSWSQKPSYQSARGGELLRSSLAITKAKKLLGWQPRVTIPEGLKNIHAYSREHAHTS
jgi:UDP-glucose 4-epimerase